MHQYIQSNFPFASNPAAPFHTPQSRPSTYAEIVAADPRIADLVLEAARLRASRRVTWRDYESFKTRLQRLVGWFASRRELQSGEAYDAAISRLVAALGV